MRLLIGSPIHERDEITKCYFRHLRSLDLTGVEVSWCFVLDRPPQTLRGRPLPSLECTSIIEVFDGCDGYTRQWDWENGNQHFRRMAFLRNLLRERALMEQVDALISIDSDICVPPDLVQKLAAAGKPWVSALVDNSALLNKGEADPELKRMRGERPDYMGKSSIWNVMKFIFNIHDETQTPIPAHYNAVKGELDFERGDDCDLAGAVCLYSRELLEKCRFAWAKQGEDIGFGLAAREAGYRASYLPIVCDHLMTPARLAAHKARCDLCR